LASGGESKHRWDVSRKPPNDSRPPQWLSDRGWGRPPQYVDLALASTEVRRIEVTFDVAPLEGHRDSLSVVVGVTGGVS
jgi:hypothetical protein